MMWKQPGLYHSGQILGGNPPVAEVPRMCFPRIHVSANVWAGAFILGDVLVEEDAVIGFQSIIRADSSAPFRIGARTNLQDYVLMHGHPGQTIEVGGEPWAVHIGSGVSVLHHTAVHGPVVVGDETFIGQHVSIYGARIGSNCVLMHGAVITENVTIGDGKFVAPGQNIWTQEQADALPDVPDKFKTMNTEVVDHYIRLSRSYRAFTPLVI